MPTTLSSDRPTAVHPRSTIGLCLCMILMMSYAQSAFADETNTPLAGEQYHTEVLGEPVNVPARDRRSVTAINFGVLWIPNGPSYLEVLPFGSLYLWRNWDDDRHRVRATLAGVVNDVNYNIGSRSMKGWEFVLTFDNTIIPVGRSEYVEGQRIAPVEVQWSYLFAGGREFFCYLIFHESKWTKYLTTSPKISITLMSLLKGQSHFIKKNM